MHAHIYSRTLKMRGGTISQANRYLGGFCSSQRIFPPQIIQVLLYDMVLENYGPPEEALPDSVRIISRN
jgi:hypothetical protein